MRDERVSLALDWAKTAIHATVAVIALWTTLEYCPLARGGDL